MKRTTIPALTVVLAACGAPPASPPGDTEPTPTDAPGPGVWVSSLALSGRAAPEEVELHHPLTIEVGLDGAVPEPALYRIAVGFTETTSEAAAPARCTFAGATALLEGSVHQVVSVTADVPRRCLPEGAEETRAALWVRVEPATGRDGARTPAQVFDAAHQDSNQGCIDAEGRPGCLTELRLVQSRGLDVAFDRLELSSSAAVLPLAPAPLEAKAHRPALLTAQGTLTVVGADPALANALEATSGQLLAEFSLRPSGSTQAWLPMLTAPDADDAAGAATVTELSPDGPSHPHFSLFPSPALADALARGGAWANASRFTLKACLRSTFDERRPDDTDPIENNCRTAEVFVSRPAPDPLGSTTQAASLSYSWSDSWGSTGTERLSYGYRLGNRASAAGISTDNRVWATLDGWIDYAVFDAKWAARATGEVAGSFYAADLAVFGDVLRDSDGASSGGAMNIDTDAWTDRTWTGRECQSWSYYYLVDIDLRGCATGRIGLDLDGDFTVRKTIQRLDGGMASEGTIGVYFRPFASAEISVTASVDGGVVRAGVSADVDVVEAELVRRAGSSQGARPLTTMSFSRRGASSYYENTYSSGVEASLELSALRGSIWVYVDYLDTWESLWGWEREWVRWGSKTIASWPARTANFDIAQARQAGTRGTYFASGYQAALANL